jgi:hypothetical protein
METNGTAIKIKVAEPTPPIVTPALAAAVAAVVVAEPETNQLNRRNRSWN